MNISLTPPIVEEQPPASSSAPAASASSAPADQTAATATQAAAAPVASPALQSGSASSVPAASSQTPSLTSASLAAGSPSSVSTALQSSPSQPAVMLPVVQGSQKQEGVELIFDQRVDLEQSKIFWNGRQIKDTFLPMETDGEYHLSYELKDSSGNILESSEQLFVQNANAPAIQTEAQTVFVSSRRTIRYSISDPELAEVKIFLDEKLVENTGQVEVDASSQSLRIEASDASGNQSVRQINIQALPHIVSSWACEPLYVAQSPVLELELDGNWAGMAVRVIHEGQETLIPFEEARLKLPLMDGQDYELELVHPLLEEVCRWKVEARFSVEPPSLPDVQEAVVQPQIPVQSGSALLESAVQPAAPIWQTVSDGIAAQSPTALLEVEAAAPSASFELEQTTARLQAFFNEEVLEEERIVIREGDSLQLRSEQGELQECLFLTPGGQSYESLEDVLEEHPLQSIPLQIQARDAQGMPVVYEVEIVPFVPAFEQVQTVGKNQIHLSCSMDENGNLHLLQEIEPALLSGPDSTPTVLEGVPEDTFRIYLDPQEDLQAVYVQGRRLTDVQLQQDGLERQYLSIQTWKDCPVQMVYRSGAQSQVEIHVDRPPLLWISWLISTLGGFAGALLLQGRHRFG